MAAVLNNIPNPTLWVVDVRNKSRVQEIQNTVNEWHITCTNNPGWQLYPSATFEAHLENYQKIAKNCFFKLKAAIQFEGWFEHYRVLAAYDGQSKLQGLAIVYFRKSKKNSTPFVEVSYLLTNIKNTCFHLPEDPNPVKGVGSGIIAKTIEGNRGSKNVYLRSTFVAREFYQKIGFIPANKQSEDEATKNYKLLPDKFDAFVKKHSYAEFCEEEILGMCEIANFIAGIELALKGPSQEAKKEV